MARLHGSLPAKVTLLVLTVLVLYALVAPVAWLLAGPLGPVAAALAAGVCLGGAIAALVVGHIFRSPQHVLYSFLLGMIARMGLPWWPAWHAGSTVAP